LQNYVNFDTYNPSIYRAEPGDKLCTELTIGADWAYASDMYEQNNEAVIELLAKSGGIGDQIDALIEQGAQIEAAGNYKSEFEKLDDEEDQVERDIITLREEILNMQLGIPTLENQIWSLEREIDRLNNSIGTQEENVENYTSRINSLHSTINIETDCPIVTASESSLNDTQKTRLEALKNLIYAGGVNLLKTYCGRLSTAQNNLDNYRATLATKQAEKDENDRKIAEYKALLPVRQTTLYEKIDRLAQIPSARAELSNALDPALAAINAQIDALMAQVLSFVSTQVASYTSSACTTMIKTSNLQLFGSNSWSGGNYGTTCNRDAALSGGFEGKVSKRLSGSWSQYGLLSTGDISNFGSGGHIDDKLANSIFANANASGGIGDLTQLGRYTGSHCITDVYDYYNRQITDNSGKVTHIEHEILGSNDWSIYRPGTFTIDVSKLDKNKWEELGEDGLQRYDIYKVENDVLLNSTSMPSGRDIILLVDGDVTITGDIKTKNSTFGTIYDIPQFTLAVTGNIIVEPTVHEIYGVYAAHDRSAADGKAGGVFYDCGLIDENEAKSTLKFRYSGLCSDYRSEIGNSAYPSPPFTYYQPNNGSLALAAQNVGLTVNGAIVADGTRFHRTNGVESIHDATPAERVRYTPLIYLQEWAYRNRIQNEMKTTLYREIAPRY
jgi:predicted  nucleic acid-binding Zn-ribbon protein